MKNKLLLITYVVLLGIGIYLLHQNAELRRRVDNLRPIYIQDPNYLPSQWDIQQILIRRGRLDPNDPNATDCVIGRVCRKAWDAEKDDEYAMVHAKAAGMRE